MHYLVDGYNLLFRFLKANPLEKTRQAMIEELNTAVSELNLSVTLVFDGGKDSLPPTLRHHFKAIELIYTTGDASADHYILETVQEAHQPKNLTIITNDRELSSRCKREGAAILPIDTFIAFLTHKRQKKIKRTPRPDFPFADSQKELKRLLTLFEERLKEHEEDLF